MNCKYISTCIPLQNDQAIFYQPREGKSAVWEDPDIQNCNYLKEYKPKSQGRQNLRKPDLYKYCENSREMRMLTCMMACPPHEIIQLNPLFMT